MPKISNICRGQNLLRKSRSLCCARILLGGTCAGTTRLRLGSTNFQVRRHLGATVSTHNVVSHHMRVCYAMTWHITCGVLHAILCSKHHACHTIYMSCYVCKMARTRRCISQLAYTCATLLDMFTHMLCIEGTFA